MKVLRRVGFVSILMAAAPLMGTLANDVSGGSIRKGFLRGAASAIESIIDESRSFLRASSVESSVDKPAANEANATTHTEAILVDDESTTTNETSVSSTHQEAIAIINQHEVSVTPLRCDRITIETYDAAFHNADFPDRIFQGYPTCALIRDTKNAEEAAGVDFAAAHPKVYRVYTNCCADESKFESNSTIKCCFCMNPVTDEILFSLPTVAGPDRCPNQHPKLDSVH